MAVDDATRLAYAEELSDERSATATAFLERALTFCESHGITVERLLTDNGSCYVSQAFGERVCAHGLRHLRTRPRRPQTNGKPEAFVTRRCRTAAPTATPRLDCRTNRRPPRASSATRMATDRMADWTATHRSAG